MYTVVRYFFKNGNEDDEIDSTYSKEKADFETAYNHGKRYAKGVKFYAFEIWNSETMETLYREDCYGNIDDNRTKKDY